MNSIQEKKKDDVHQSITFVARKCLEQLLNNCMSLICTGREKEISNRLTIHFVLPFRVRSTTKNKREKKLQDQNSDDDFKGPGFSRKKKKRNKKEIKC